MKELFKAFVYLILTAAIGVGAYFVASAATEAKVYSGTTIRFSTDSSYYIDIGADSVKLEAASSDFFVLHKPSGETLVPVLGTPPLGWMSEVYYTVTSANAPGGRWNINEGSPSIVLSSTSPISVTVYMTSDQRTSLDFVIGLIGFIVWFIILWILHMTGFSGW
jgi:hypothetical protein